MHNINQKVKKKLSDESDTPVYRPAFAKIYTIFVTSFFETIFKLRYPKEYIYLP